MPHLIFQGLSGDLPTSQYDLMDDADRRVGFLQIRHRPSHTKEFPAQMASHIYYEIESAYRGKGYGTKILQLGLEEAKKIGLKEVILTCKEENVASRKIIEGNGGVFIEKVFIPSINAQLFKYKISIPI